MITAPEGLRFPTWTPDDGPAAYTWSRMPAGDRCAWTCIWIARDPRGSKTYGPQHWKGTDFDSMSNEELLAELEDVGARGLLATERPNAVVLTLDFLMPDETSWRAAAWRIIEKARPRYQEFLAEWTPPDRNMLHMEPACRKGWGIFPVAPAYEIRSWRDEPKPPKSDLPEINFGSGRKLELPPTKRHSRNARGW